jgi:hypothetical protein
MKNLLLIIAWLLSLICLSKAQIPEQISWQGQLTNSGGDLLEGQYDITFSIYNTETGGNAIWTEIHNDVSISKGVVSLILGSINPLSVNFNEQLWLEISIDGEGPLSRRGFTSSPYSFYTKAIEDNSITSEKIKNASILSEDISQMGAEVGQVLTWNSEWSPQNIPVETDPVYTSSPSGSVTENMINSWTTAYGWGNHADAEYLTDYTETDPIFLSSPAGTITQNMQNSWTTAYGWGNHADAEYLTDYTETDPIFLSSPAGTITQNMQNSWTTAYGWGNHADAEYLTDYTETDPIFLSSPAGTITQNMQNSWTTAYGWGNHADAEYLTDYTETDPIFLSSPAGTITQNMQNSWTAAYGWGNHADAEYLTDYTETDPIFLSSPAGTITQNMQNSWTDAFGWGNHADAEYLTDYTETDPIFLSSPAGTITHNMQNSWTTAYGWGNHADAEYLTDYTETDPIFLSSSAGTITQNMQNSWTTAYGWGNHADAEYLTDYTETDPIFLSSPAGTITQNMQNSWTAAYGWGNHANAAYLTQSTSLGATNGQILKWDDGDSRWEPITQAGDISDGDPFILRDSEGNMRYRFDPDESKLEIFDESENSWYSIQVNSPPITTQKNDDGSYSTTQGGKQTFYDASGNKVKETNTSSYEMPGGRHVNQTSTSFYSPGSNTPFKTIEERTKNNEDDYETTTSQSIKSYDASGSLIQEASVEKVTGRGLDETKTFTVTQYNSSGTETKRTEKTYINGSLTKVEKYENGSIVNKQEFDTEKNTTTHYDMTGSPESTTEQYNDKQKGTYQTGDEISAWWMGTRGWGYQAYDGSSPEYGVTYNPSGGYYQVGVGNGNNDPYMRYYPDDGTGGYTDWYGSAVFNDGLSTSGQILGGNGVFNGDLEVFGDFWSSTKYFRIDHPFDPENKYLIHACIESNEVLNKYSGNVITDENGYANVTLPDYFEAINIDFRYQLTCIGQFAQAIIFEEIKNNRFSIKTDKPNVKVSWEVTARRNDKYMRENPYKDVRMKDE